MNKKDSKKVLKKRRKTGLTEGSYAWRHHRPGYCVVMRIKVPRNALRYDTYSTDLVKEYYQINRFLLLAAVYRVETSFVKEKKKKQENVMMK